MLQFLKSTGVFEADAKSNWRRNRLLILCYHGVSLEDEHQWRPALDLPPRSVSVTFDDGTYDFYQQAYPLLRKYEIPVTVYQTTCHSDNPRPVFNLICSYMPWKRRAEKLNPVAEPGLKEPMDMST